MDKLTT